MLAAGKIIYHGPREGVLPFFQGLGFACPPRKNAADFIQELPMPGGGFRGRRARGLVRGWVRGWVRY